MALSPLTTETLRQVLTTERINHEPIGALGDQPAPSELPTCAGLHGFVDHQPGPLMA